MMKRMILLLLVGLLAACSSTGKKDGVAGVDEAGGADGLSGEQRDHAGAEAMGIAGASGFQGDPLDDPASPLATRVIYFDYDSSQISAEDREIIAAHGRYLLQNAQAKVYMEGHTDERGTREYNIGLGDRRAQAVRRLFEFQGVRSGQIQTVSYGEEKPAAEGHTESAWRLNRRVELVYPQY